jgi:hypothetical protein
MKLNGDEKRIQQLFREMSSDERRRAPEFADVLAAAKSGRARSLNRALTLRLAMAVATIIVGLLVAMAVIVRPSKPQGAAAPEQVSAPPLQEADPDSNAPSRPDVKADNRIASRRHVTKRTRSRRHSDQIAIAVKSLFAWQSPTNSLLKTPDDELLNSLPRLGESLQMIKTYSPEQFN